MTTAPGAVLVQKAKNLRGFAIESFAEMDVGRNRIGPPIAFDAALAVDVAHVGHDG